MSWVDSRCRKGKPKEALRLLDDAHRRDEAGCFALVLEGTPAELAARTTESLRISERIPVAQA